MARFPLIAIAFFLVTLGVSTWALRGNSGVGKPAPACASQPTSTSNVATSPADVIDGAKHPELIPDLVAYRLFLITVAEPENATAERKQRQRAFLRAAGIEDDDLRSVVNVLATFKANYDDLVERYNDSVDVATRAGLEPDLRTFLSQQDALVESTREALKATLVAQRMGRVEAYVQREKRNMKVAKEDK